MNEDSGVWFAWYPVQLESGEWAWLQNVNWERDFMAMKANEYLGLAQNEYIYTKIEESE